jgi:hypothetical protein
MAVSTEIVRAYRAPRQVLRRQIAAPKNEGRALIYLTVACLLFFIAQWPRLSREAFLDPSIPLDARLGGALAGWLMFAPLAFYGIGALSHLLAKLFGGRGSFYSARLALFWSLLVISPLVLLLGLVSGFIGQGPAQNATGLLLLAAFLYIWGNGLWEAERRPDQPA